MTVFAFWRRAGNERSVERHVNRFDASSAVTIASVEQLAAMRPRYLRMLGAAFSVESLADRLVPVQLEDKSVAIFAQAAYVGSDQADELVQRIQQAGYQLASPERYVLASSLLLALVRGQVTSDSLAGLFTPAIAPSRPALVAAFHDLVEWGVRHGASDIHFNVHLAEAKSEVNYTISGRYVMPACFRGMPTSTLLDMLSVAWMDIRGGNGSVFDPLREQQGSLTMHVDGKPFVLRWSSMAADVGPSVCLRLLSRSVQACATDLDSLGYMPDQLAQIRRAMVSESGAVIFSGTVGSGKSTSLAALVSSLPSHRKVITLEDPVEYLIPGAIQNTLVRNLDTSSHDVFAAKLRSLRRSAMSDVLLGEIRDVETGRAFMDLVGSGVNVYSTVHAPSAAMIPVRLSSGFIAVPADFLATPGVLRLLVFQALLPQLCDQCAVPVVSADARHVGGSEPIKGLAWQPWLELVRQLYGRSPGKARLRNPEGCEVCRQAELPELYGYCGRTVAAEIIEPALSWVPARSAMESAVMKALDGQVDLRDVESRFHAFETEKMMRAARKRLSGGTA